MELLFLTIREVSELIKRKEISPVELTRSILNRIEEVNGRVQFAAALPFKWVIWFPSAALIGQLSTAQMIVGLIAQGCWLIGGVAVFRIVWRAGIKRYS